MIQFTFSEFKGLSMHDYNLKKKRIKPQETLLDDEKFMFRTPIKREFEESDDPNHIVVNYEKLPMAENGSWALGAGLVASLFFIWFIRLLCLADGDPKLKVSAVGVCGLLWALAAVYFSVRGLAEKDRNHTLCFVGIALGAFQIMTWIITVIITSR